MQRQKGNLVQDRCFYVVQDEHDGVMVSGYGVTEAEATVLLREWTTLFHRANDERGGSEKC